MKKVLAILLAIAMIAAMAACAQKAAPADETKTSGETTSTAGETADNTAEDTADTASSESYKIFLITMDQMDQYWTNIDAGCKKAAEELGNVEYQWTAPDVKDDAKQIEMINNAVANGAQIAVDELNAKGGLQFELNAQDDEHDPSGGQRPRGGQRCAEGGLGGWRADRLRRFPGKLYAVCCDVQHRQHRSR